jgi:hypothetical protein
MECWSIEVGRVPRWTGGGPPVLDPDGVPLGSDDLEEWYAYLNARYDATVLHQYLPKAVRQAELALVVGHMRRAARALQKRNLV